MKYLKFAPTQPTTTMKYCLHVASETIHWCILHNSDALWMGPFCGSFDNLFIIYIYY